MKKKHLVIALIAAIVTLIFVQSSILETLVIFLLVGAIPGTPISLPPMAMLALLGGSVIALTHWVAARQLYPGSPKVVKSRNKVLRRTARKSVRKKSAKSSIAHRRRYSHLDA